MRNSAQALVAVALIPVLACSCGTFWSSNEAAPQQSPKAQADAPQQLPKVQADAVQPVPKAQANVELETPKPQSPVVQQTPKAQAAEPHGQPLMMVNTEAARKALIGADLAFSRACEEKGAPDAFYEFMAPEGVCLLTGEPPVEGRDAIKVRFAAFPGESISWKPREAEVCSSSDLGYTWGTYQLQRSTPDKQTSASGKYAIVWKKQSDGSWKGAMFITSAGPATQRTDE